MIIRWAAQAGKRKQADEAFRRRYEVLDEMLYHPIPREEGRGMEDRQNRWAWDL